MHVYAPTPRLGRALDRMASSIEIAGVAVDVKDGSVCGALLGACMKPRVAAKIFSG